MSTKTSSRPNSSSFSCRKRSALSLALATALAGPMAHAAPGDPIGPEFQVNTFTTSRQVNPRIGLDADGDFVIAWTDYSGQDGSQFGIYAQRYAADGTPQGGEFRVNTTTTANQLSPSVALDADGDFVIAWTSFGQDGSDSGVYAQRYSADGTPQGGEFRVNTTTTDRQNSPSVALDVDGDFVIAWQSGNYSGPGQDGSQFGIYAQRYSADGTPQGSEFRVNTTTTDRQNSPSVALDADGDFVIAWSSYFQDGSYYDIYAQRYVADGTPQGAEFRVNTYTTDSQSTPSVALDADGDFVIAWSSYYQDGSYSGVYAQRYAADGTPQGAEFRGNTYTTGIQFILSVALDADGDFVIAWSSYYQDGSDSGIYAQRYAADGTPQGAEYRVNTYTTSDQRFARAAMDADGDFVITWESYGQDGSDSGIYARRYQGPTSTLPPDADGDGLLDGNDNCPTAFNPDQADSNGNGIGDACDPPPNDNFSDATTINAVPFSASLSTLNATSEPGEPPAPCADIGKTVWYRFTPSSDISIQADTGGSAFDTVLAIYTGTALADLAEVGCDDQSGFDNTSKLVLSLTGGTTYFFQVGGYFGDQGALTFNLTPLVDEDNDGVLDSVDNCPALPNPDQADADNDGTGDACDTDSDGDGILNTADNCPTASNPDQADSDNDGMGDVCDPDRDNDGVLNESDNCPTLANPDQTDTDGDGTGDACDSSALGLCLNRPVTLRGTAGDDTLTGTPGNDVIDGLEGNDVIDGLDGNDKLCGRGGADVLTGNSGNDVLVGGSGNDRLSGEAGTDALYGTYGDDELLGGADNDYLSGGRDDDSLDGGDGADRLDGGSGTDACNNGEQLNGCEP